MDKMDIKDLFSFQQPSLDGTYSWHRFILLVPLMKGRIGLATNTAND